MACVSEERTGRRFRPSRRSKSEGPPTRDFPFQSEYRLQYGKLLAERQAYQDQLPLSAPGVNNQRSDDWEEEMMTASFPPLVPATATTKTRISTEYRLQFAWPRASEILVRKAEEARNTAAAAAAGGPPRKSLSMGAIRPTCHLAPVHKKNIEEPEGASELEPLVGSEDTLDTANADGGELRGEEKIQEETFSKDDKNRRRKEFKTEYKKRFRPFSQYEYTEGRFTKRREGDVIDTYMPDHPIPLPLADLTPQSGDSWYHEVLELRKKAGEYKHRGWGTELVPQHIAELYNKQMALWDQVSRRSSLSALSLASTSPRSITKEEKERENSKKSSPTKSFVSNRMMASGRAENRVDSMERKKMDKDSDKKEAPRSRKEFLIRHHLERTTGAVDGALLPSPTREKLEPVIPRRKDEDISIKSPPKSSPKSSPRSARSQSVGPISENRSSPKRQPRAPSAAPVGAKNINSTSGGAANAGPKAHPNGPIHTERRPRPTSLSTAPSRSKSSSIAMRNEEGKSHHAMKPKHNLPTAPTGKSVANGLQSGGKLKGDRSKHVAEKKDDSGDAVDTPSVTQQEPPPAVHTQKATPTGTSEEKPKDSSPVVTPAAPTQQPCVMEQPTAYLEECEQIVKSPPEPTRVKSPEQILMRSPEPVNWTVPLDTGKTFTVTQNVREGELNRPLSEAKQPGATVIEQHPEVSALSTGQDINEKASFSRKSPSCDPMTTSMMGFFGEVNGVEDKSEESQGSQEIKPLIQPIQKPTTPVGYEKPMAGTTLKCLDDPSFDTNTPYPLSGAHAAVSSQPESSSASPYRVLEAPSDVEPIPSVARPTGTPYRILEAPDSPGESPTKGALMMSPSSSRSMASDVLEKARTRFDKFWGKSTDSEKEGKV
ncbi:hypothetical protein B566_EDAN011853 [Ephemera danica]|nr:hypothetical protein B566_EDAN011853 [Ephemera danica]